MSYNDNPYNRKEVREKKGLWRLIFGVKAKNDVPETTRTHDFEAKDETEAEEKGNAFISLNNRRFYIDLIKLSMVIIILYYGYIWLTTPNEVLTTDNVEEVNG